MTKRTRTTLFLLCVLLFLVLAPAIILYGQGFRLDLQNRRLTQTGAIYVKTLPKSSEVFLDDKLNKKTDFLFGSALLDNLLPGRYLLEIKKEGFATWKKTLEVKESGVTEVKNVVLFPAPETLSSLKLLPKNAEDFYLDPKGQNAILKKTNSQGWYLTFLNLGANQEEVLLQEKDFAKKTEVDWLDWQWSPDGQKAIISLGLAEKETFALIDLTQRPAKISPLDYLSLNQLLRFDPGSSNRIFWLKENDLWQADLNNKTSSQVLSGILAFTPSNQKVTYLDEKGFLYQTDTSSWPATKPLNPKALEVSAETGYQISLIHNQIYLEDGRTLWWWNPDSQNLEVLRDSIQNWKVSPDRQNLADSNNGEIWLLSLKDSLEQPPRKTGDKVLLARFSERITQLFWWDSHHLIFAVGNNIKIMETDERDQPNITNLTSLEKPVLFLNENNQKNVFWLLSQGNLANLSQALP